MHNIRRRRMGSAMADTPAVLWVLFVLILFPLIDLAAVGMRYTFMLTSSREAAMAASRAKTFFADTSASDRSARNIANQVARATASRFNGLTISAVNTSILETNLSTNSVNRYQTPLAAPADVDDYLYAYETTVVGTVEPLVRYRGPVFGNIPGLTGPINVSITSQKMCENTQGLTQ
jgi:Flp pilus assembly protein TadG